MALWQKESDPLQPKPPSSVDFFRKIVATRPSALLYELLAAMEVESVGKLPTPMLHCILAKCTNTSVEEAVLDELDLRQKTMLEEIRRPTLGEMRF